MDVENRQRPSSLEDFQKGTLLLIDKPLDWTSFDVVNKIRYKLKHKLKVKKIKVGHAGTLDPRATGLLIICTGKFTKKLQNLQGLTKDYIGTIKLGATTPSFDAETAEDEQFPIEHLTPELLGTVKQEFIGEISQVPPMFSAIKVDGQPLYKKARKGQMVKIEPRKIIIERFNLTRIELPEVDFEVKCSKGTYIRSLAYDFGKSCESGGYLTALRRTKIGDYDIKDAWKLEDFIAFVEEM